MANTFKNSITGSVGTSPFTVYTTPVATSTTVIGLNVSNIVETNINVDIKVNDNSTSENRFLIKNALITPESSLVAVGGDQKVVLEAEDTIEVTSSQSGSADVIVSVLEIS